MSVVVFSLLHPQRLCLHDCRRSMKTSHLKHKSLNASKSLGELSLLNNIGTTPYSVLSSCPKLDEQKVGNEKCLLVLTCIINSE